MAWIGPVLTAATAAVRVAGDMADGQARAASQAHELQQTRQQAVALGDQASAQEETLRRRNRQMLAARAVAMAESGAGTGGSNGLIAAQDAALAELEALSTRHEGRVGQIGLENRARRLADQPRGLAGLRTGLNALSWLGRTGSQSW
jgi:hypothetical protein